MRKASRKIRMVFFSVKALTFCSSALVVSLGTYLRNVNYYETGMRRAGVAVYGVRTEPLWLGRNKNSDGIAIVQ